jgi:hypothetical protein
MTLVTDKLAAPVTRSTDLPPEAEFILSALEAGQYSGATRRKNDRVQHRVCAYLKLFSDQTQAPPWAIYVRDLTPKGLGFITRHRLPLGYGGILTLPKPGGKTIKLDCTLLRCRPAVEGWFEGSMYFNREQAWLVEEIRASESK